MLTQQCVLQNWYECQMQLLSQWLEKRPEFSLHKTQLSSAEELFQVSKTLVT